MASEFSGHCSRCKSTVKATVTLNAIDEAIVRYRFITSKEDVDAH